VASSLTASRTRFGVRGFVARFGAPLALVYFAMIGGTQWGEYSGSLRVVNALLAAVVLVIYVAGITRRSDRVDRLALLALLVFLAACLASAFPRQSLDAALAALCWVAVFYIARDVLADERQRATIGVTMMALSVVTTLFLAAAEIGVAMRWVSLTTGTILPPLGMPVDVRPWGHEYDMAMLAVMLYPAWFIGSVGRVRGALAGLVGIVLAIAVLLMGARNLWLAIVLATLLVAVPNLVRYLARVTTRMRVAIIGAFVAGALVVFAIAGGPILDRLLTGTTIGQRTAMWTAATEAWLHRPIAGYGPGTYPWLPGTTDFFSFNSGHHRHPHNVVFQLLPEAGILGLAAAAILLFAIGWPLVRQRRSLELWPIAVFLFGGIASNPTVYPYLIVVAIVWAALGLPRVATTPSPESSGQVARRRLSFAGVGLIAVMTLPLLLGGLFYDSAVVAARKSEISAARDALLTATALDPGMAIYARQLGAAELMEANDVEAIAHLRRATHLNPLDGVAWRELAIGLNDLGRPEEARAALGEALLRDRSDPSNLLLLARWQSNASDVAALRETAAEIALAWPTVTFAPGWRELLRDAATPAEVVNLALARWRDGAPSPEPLVGQPLLLSILAGEEDLTEAARLAGLPETLVRASEEVVHCGGHAADLLNALPADDRRTDVYWALRLQHASENGQADATALDLYELRTGSLPTLERARAFLNPLRQNNTDGALDPFGYGRLPMAWPEAAEYLPDPKSGQARWLIDQPSAREASGITFGSCR